MSGLRFTLPLTIFVAFSKLLNLIHKAGRLISSKCYRNSLCSNYHTFLTYSQSTVNGNKMIVLSINSNSIHM